MIHCKHDKMIEASELKPNPKNPNTHPEAQINLLAKILETQGWRYPVIVSKRSDFIVSGHGRVLAAEKMEDQKVPVVFQDFENEAEENAHLLADNRISELSEMNNTTLKDLLLEMDTGELDMDLTGYDTGALERLMTQFHVEPPEEFQEIDENIDTSFQCPKCGYKWSGEIK